MANLIKFSNCRLDTNGSKLYIVPTPIGNLEDITQRALKVLDYVDLIAAENLMHTHNLLKYFKINTKITAMCEYTEKKKTKFLIDSLQKGKNIAVVSNAGTPLINDPGYYLVRRCRQLGIRIIPLPGACAAITALSASGLATNRFCYEGFLPTTKKARCNKLRSILLEPRTIIFYETPHRILDSLEDIAVELGSDRYVVLAREMTKIWESIKGGSISQLLLWIQEDRPLIKGEIVLIIEGYQSKQSTITADAIRTLSLLKQNITLKQAIMLTSKIHNIKKNIIYNFCLNKIS